MLEAEKFEYAEIDRGMKSQAALVRSDRVIELHPVAALVADIALVIGPRNPEHNHPIGLGHPLENLHLEVDWFIRDIRKDGSGYFGNRLMELGFTRITLLYPIHESFEIFFGLAHCSPPLFL